MGKIGVKARIFNEMVKVSSNDNRDEGDEMAEVFDNSIPVLSPPQGFRDAISEAAEWDEQLSEGKALSDREQAVLQSLEIMTRNADEATWLKAADLRDRVREIMGINRDQMGHAQWIGHVLNRLSLIDRNRKKAYTGGQMYLIDRTEVCDMMRRYDVTQIAIDSQKTDHTYHN